jgi:hypothetical protein
MTPPDKNGEQVFWDRTETENGGILFLPEDADESATKLLVPENYKQEVGQDGECIGFGSLPYGPGQGHFEAGYVHRRGGFALKSAPFKSQERMLDWLAANLMMRQAILNLAKDGHDFIEREVKDPHISQIFKIKTPQYFGALVLDSDSGKSIIAMSDESVGGGKAPSIGLFEKIDGSLLGITMRTMESLYPDSTVRWDSYNQGWILRANEGVLVRIDLFSTDPSIEPHRPTVRF